MRPEGGRLVVTVGLCVRSRYAMREPHDPKNLYVNKRFDFVDRAETSSMLPALESPPSRLAMLNRFSFSLSALEFGAEWCMRMGRWFAHLLLP